MHHDRRFRSFRELAQVPGMLALLEDAILNHRAPVVIIKDHKGVGHRAIGQIDRALGRGRTIVPPPHDDRIDGLSFVIASMGVTLVCWASP